MFFVRGKNEHILCTKCKAYNGPFAKCRCQLKEPKRFTLDINGDKKKEKFSFFYIYTIEVDWQTAEEYSDPERRHQRIDIIADIKLEDNPFQHCVVDLYDNYYNLSKADKIEIIGPAWHSYHITKYGSPTEWCYCEELPEPEDFK